MAIGYLNERTKKILQMLMADNGFVSLSQIAQNLGLSKRSIYYEICKVNEWLQSCGLPDLEVTRGKGITLDGEMKLKIDECMQDVQKEDSYVFSPMERVKVIICYIIVSEKAINIEELQDYCQVSRNTIFNDLQAVSSQLQKYDLCLEYEKKKGYRIAGDCIRVRALFFLYFNMLEPLFESGILTFINTDEINVYFEKLKLIENEQKVQYIDGNLTALAAMMPVMLRGDEQPYFPDLKRNEIIETNEYKLIKKYFNELPDREMIYLCLHLLGSRVSFTSNNIFEDNQNQSIYVTAKALVEEFEKTACVSFENRDDLIKGLFSHIKSSMYRYRYGIQIGNLMADDIIREYPDVFEITRIACKYLEQQIGVPISDGEVAYLALHFGSHLDTGHQMDKSLRILIVCVNGISTGNMIKHEVERMLPHANIVGVAAASNIKNVQSICDLVISSVKIKSVVPVIVVNPIMTDFDKKNIMKHPLVKSQFGIVDVNALFNIVKKYVPKEKHSSLRKDIEEFLTVPQEKGNLVVNNAVLELKDFLDEKRVMLLDEEMEWNQALNYAATPLIENKSITSGYVGKIIERLREYGPYMFVTPGVIIAHAKPEDGVNKVDVSVCVLKNSISFEKNHNAKIIIVLAAQDQEKHLKILKDIVTVFSVGSRIDELVQMNTTNEIIEYMKSVL